MFRSSPRAAHRLILLLLGLSACEQSGPEGQVRVGDAALRAPAVGDTGAPMADDTGAAPVRLISPLHPDFALPEHRLNDALGLPLAVTGTLSAALADALPWCGAAADGRLVLRGEGGRAQLDRLLAHPGVEGVRLLSPAELEALDLDSCASGVADGVSDVILGGRGASAGARPYAATGEDVTAPVGETVVINGGDATTNSSRISLAISASDDTAVTHMCISQSTTCTSWRSYATSTTTSVSGAAGPRTIYVSFRDAAGNVSSAISDTIIYDATAPVDGSVSATPSAAEVAMSWSGFVDPGTGIAEYVLRRASGTRAPSTCRSGIEDYRGPATSVTVSGLVDGTTYSWRLCAVDGAGNTSTGVTATERPATEYDPPTDGSIVLNGGAAWTKSTTLTVTPAATDPSGVSYICMSESPTLCTRWTRMGATVRTRIGRTPGEHTVYAWFRDAMGNATTTPVSATISYDAV